MITPLRCLACSDIILDERELQGTALTVTYIRTIASADSLAEQVSLGKAGNGTFTAKRQPRGENAVIEVGGRVVEQRIMDQRRRSLCAG
jgi:hypothetical protein